MTHLSTTDKVVINSSWIFDRAQKKKEKKEKKDLRGCHIYRRFNRIMQGREEARLNSRRELFTLWRGSRRTVRFKIFSFRVFFFFLFIIGSITTRKIYRHPRNGFFHLNYNVPSINYNRRADIFRGDCEYEFRLSQVDKILDSDKKRIDGKVVRVFR